MAAIALGDRLARRSDVVATHAEARALLLELDGSEERRRAVGAVP